MALPTICQQRPRSPSLPLPSFISFHPPISLPQPSTDPAERPPVLCLIFQALPQLLSFILHSFHVSGNSTGIYLAIGHD